MRYFLDTNAAAALMRGTPAIVDRLATHARGEVLLPQPVVAEIAYGIERLPRSRRRDALAARFSLLTSEIPRVEWDDGVSEVFARIKAVLERRGRRLEDFDLAIAAHALAADGVLVTSDADDMGRVPDLRVEDWSRPL